MILHKETIEAHKILIIIYENKLGAFGGLGNLLKAAHTRR